MEETPLVIAVFSTKDTSSEICQQLATVSLPAEAQQLPVSSLRNSLSSSLSASLPAAGSTAVSYVFLTSRGGWELSEELEEKVSSRSVIDDSNVVRIRLRYPQRRVGVLYEKDPICFLLLPPNALNLMDLRLSFQDQHPDLSHALMAAGDDAVFLDVNGWPVTRQQELIVPLTAILQNNTVQLAKPVYLGVNPVSSDTGGGSSQKSKKRPPQTIHATVVTPSEEFIQRAPPLSQPSKSPSFTRKSVGPPEIMLSYVHKESSGPAVRLSEELTRLGFTVFLDKTSIKPGDDWQDVLNESICECKLFVPLVTPLYGLTEWTNKEVKLADTLNKFIIPVNFLSKWPPMCLAIQFATTQFIRWQDTSEGTHLALNTVVNTVAADIAEQYNAMKEQMKEAEEREKEEEKEEEKKKEEKKEKGEKSAKKSLSLGRSLPDMIRKSIFKQDSGGKLIVISYHPTQLEFIEEVRHRLESRGYEVWASMAGDDLQKREIFTKKVNISGVVIFVLSQEYATSPSCEQEMYYVEGRKRIIPIIVNSFQIPGWMSTLIGPDSFLDSRSPNFQEVFMEEVECATVPAKAEGRLRKLVEQKTQLHKMCTSLKKKLPKGRLVYVTGSTKITSKNGLAICEEFGKMLAKHLDCFVVTGGFYGVGEAVAKSFYKERKELGQTHGVIHIQAKSDPQDHSMQARQNSDGTFQLLPYGETHFYCDSVRQRDMLTPKVIDLCILIEGGPSAAFEAHQFSWSGYTVVPVVSTGGAAGGKFNAPPGIFYKPHYVNDSDWSVLSDEAAEPTDVATALVNIVNCHRVQ